MRITFRITFTLLENFGKINFACVRMRNEISLTDIFPINRFNSTNEQSSYVILCIPRIHPRNRVIYFCLYTDDITVTKLYINYITVPWSAISNSSRYQFLQWRDFLAISNDLRVFFANLGHVRCDKNILSN